jgi:hypothetical protein
MQHAREKNAWWRRAGTSWETLGGGRGEARALALMSAFEAIADIAKILAAACSLSRRKRRSGRDIGPIHLQAGLTCLIAAGIASFPVMTMSQFLAHWLLSWLISWVTILPIVLLAAPLIRAASMALTREERAN